MSSQKQSNHSHQAFSSESETSHQNTNMQSINIPGWSRKIYPESAFVNPCNPWTQGTISTVSQKMHPEPSYVIPSRQDTNPCNAWNQGNVSSVSQKIQILPEPSYAIPSRQDTSTGNTWSQRSTAFSLPQKIFPEPVRVIPSRKDAESFDAWNQNNLRMLQKILPETSYGIPSNKNNNSSNAWSQSSDNSMAQEIYPESNYAVVPSSTITNSSDSIDCAVVPSNKITNSSVSVDWAQKFVIPWHKMPATVMSCLLNKTRLNHRNKQLMIRQICNEIFDVTSDPSQRDMEVIGKRTYDQFPEALCDACGGKVQLNKYDNLMKHLRNKVEMKKMELRGNGDLDPSLSVAENQRRCMSECYGKETSSALIPYVETMSANSSNPSSSDLSRVSSTAPSDSVLEDFIIPWHKIPINMMESLLRKDTLASDDRKEIIRILCDEIWKQRQSKSGMEVIAKKIYERFPEFNCAGVTGEKNFAKQLRQRMGYLNNRLRRNKKKCQPQGSEVSSSQVEAQLLSDSPEFVGSRGPSPWSPSLENIYVPSHSIPRLDSPINSMQDSISSIPSPWAVSFKIPWLKMPKSLVTRLENKERLTLVQKMDLVSVICEEIQKIDPNPEHKDIRFIAEKASEEYPESLCDIVAGEPVGYGTLAEQLWMRMVNIEQTFHAGGLKRKLDTYESYGLLEGELKKAKLEPDSEQSYEAADLIRQLNSS